MLNRIKSMLHRHLLQVPLIHTWNTKRQFKVERELIEGCHHAKSPHRSIIHFSVNKAATQYTKSILSRCAAENGIVLVRINDYAFSSEFPFLDHLSAHEMVQYQHIFKPSGYLYSLFGGMVAGIPNLDDYHIVLMIRDPRDVLTSDYFSIAYSHIPPKGRNKIESFMERRDFARQVGVDQFVIDEGERVRRVYQRYLDLLVKRANVYVATYEDMISDFPAWLADLLDYCELTISSHLKQELLKENKKSRPPKEDSSKHIRQMTPGDHERKLQPETIAQLNSLLSSILREFKYT